MHWITCVNGVLRSWCAINLVSGCPKMLRVSVRCVESEPKLTLSLTIAGSLRHLQRPKEEALEKTLRRLSLTAAKGNQKRKRYGADAVPVGTPVVRLLERESGKEVLGDVLNERAWLDGAELVMEEEKYKVILNPPVADKLHVSGHVMTGCPVVPQVDLQLADATSCQWVWRRVQAQSAPVAAAPSLDPVANHPVVYRGMIYWPTNEDLGCQLLVECTPGRSDGQVGDAVRTLTCPVEPGPKLAAIQRRHQLTPTRLSSPQSFRVVSYNTLADCYSTNNFALEVLYPYCPPKILPIEYRQPIIVKELVGYNGDILCLQEVGEKCFERFLQPAMKESGYLGCFAKKTAPLSLHMCEGEAVFFSDSKFELMKSTFASLAQFLVEEAECSDLHQLLQRDPSLLKDVQGIPTIVQLLLLRVREEERYLLVANTHLYFHPAADHIRLIQAIVAVRAITKMIKQSSEMLSSGGHTPRVAVVFCGDFNSCQCIAAYQFLAAGCVTEDHPDWTKYRLLEIPRCSCNQPPDGKGTILNSLLLRQEKEETMEFEESDMATGTPPKRPDLSGEFHGLSVTHELSLEDACSPLPYTNFIMTFKAVLDYVFVDRTQLSVERVVPLPSHQEVTENVALPSIEFPSDHLALVCDLKWKDQC